MQISTSYYTDGTKWSTLLRSCSICSLFVDVLLLPVCHSTLSLLVPNKSVTEQRLLLVCTIGGLYFLALWAFTAQLQRQEQKIPSMMRISRKKAVSTMVTKVVHLVLLLLSCIVLFHIGAILFGAYIVENFVETLTFSLVMTVLIGGFSSSVLESKFSTWINFYLSGSYQLLHEQCLVKVALMTLCGAYFGGFVIPLDWDRPWQVWPVPCCVGALLGNMAAHISVIYSTFSHKYKWK